MVPIVQGKKGPGFGQMKSKTDATVDMELEPTPVQSKAPVSNEDLQPAQALHWETPVGMTGSFSSGKGNQH
jgi:hypothetical protein